MQRKRIPKRAKSSRISIQFSKAASIKNLQRPIFPKENDKKFRLMKKPKTVNETLFNLKEKNLRKTQLLHRDKPFEFLKKKPQRNSPNSRNTTNEKKDSEFYKMKKLHNFFRMKKKRIFNFEQKSRIFQKINLSDKRMNMNNMMTSGRRTRNQSQTSSTMNKYLSSNFLTKPRAFSKKQTRRTQSTRDFLSVQNHQTLKSISKTDKKISKDNFFFFKNREKSNTKSAYLQSNLNKFSALAKAVAKVLSKIYKVRLKKSKSEFVKLLFYNLHNPQFLEEKELNTEEAMILKNLIFKNNNFFIQKIWIGNFSEFLKGKIDKFEQEGKVTRA